MSGKPHYVSILGVVLTVGWGGAGCDVGFTTDVSAVLDPTVISGGIRPAEDTVVVRFQNFAADEAVDVEFYVSDQALDNLPDDLFTPDNLFTSSVGVAGTGIIRPGHQDVIELPCSSDLTIGTRGGTFLDDETGEQRGVGIPRWGQEGPLALCGTVVTFEFSGDGTDFNTVLRIGY